MAKGEITAQEGSFPLTRGKLDSENNLWEELRLISAHAGKTSATHGRHSDAQAHPRSRGENKSLVRPLLTGPGSSPLTQGKPVDGAGHVRLGRLIPAHAGKTPPPRHTHSPDPGSSPLTRGKRSTGRRRAEPERLIPAHAGKTTRRQT